MRGPALTFALLILSAGVQGQGMLGGVAHDLRTDATLPCIDVTLLSAQDSVLQRTRTRANAQFLFTVTAGVPYRLRFNSWGVKPLSLDVAPLAAGADDVRNYRLDFPLASDSLHDMAKYVSDSVAPPVPRARSKLPVYPRNMLQRGFEGKVVARFLVDSVGAVPSSEIHILAASHVDFATSVRSYVRRTKFTPGRHDRIDRCELVTQLFVFSLRGQL